MESFQEAGKSYIALFVVPTNRLLQAKDVEARAYNKFFSIAVLEDVEEKLSTFTYSPFDVVVFEKICMSRLYVLDKGKQFITDCPDMVVIGTGDVKHSYRGWKLTQTRD